MDFLVRHATSVVVLNAGSEIPYEPNVMILDSSLKSQVDSMSFNMDFQVTNHNFARLKSCF